jgi:hypothetical protein
MPMMLSVLLPACSSSSPSPAQLRQYNATVGAAVSRRDRSFACRRARKI